MVIFNEAQLATYDEARALRERLNSDTRFADCQVLGGDDEHGATPKVDPNFPWLPPQVAMVGIHRLVWEGGPGGFPEPASGQRKFLHFRFVNGFDGMNVGLCIDKFRRFIEAGPLGASYVLGELAKEAKAGMR